MLKNIETAKALIIDRSRQLVEKLIDNRGHDRPPFLSGEYASLCGIKNIVKAELGQTSGVLLRFSESYMIKVNKNHNLSRQNFSCAHEIGHILFNELGLEQYITKTEYRTFNPQAIRTKRAKDIEHLCDAAAAELLMPEMVFKKYLSSLGVGIGSIERLANTFRVSYQSAAIRIAEVSTEPCIALLWRRQKGKSTAPFRLVWPKDEGHYLPKHTPVRYPSTLHKAHESDTSVRCRRDFQRGKETKRLLMESKGFGRSENRYVISLAYIK